MFDPEGGHWYLQWLGPIAVGVTLLLGLLAYAVQRRDYHATVGAAPLPDRPGHVVPAGATAVPALEEA